MIPRNSGLFWICGVFAVAVLFGACSKGQKENAQSRNQSLGEGGVTSEGIVPSPAYAFHELRLSDAATATSGIDFSSGRESPRVLWEVDGTGVHIGESLEPSFLHVGARVAAIVQSSNEDGGWSELARYECVITNSAPRVQEVQLQRDTQNPYHIQAVLRADDSDQESIDLSYQWFLDGKPLPDENGSSIVLDEQAQGSQVQVEVVASDGKDRSLPVRSPKMAVEGPSIFLTVGDKAEFRKGSDGGREVILPLEYTDGARLQLIDAPSNVYFEPGHLVWLPGKDEKVLELSVRVSAKDGSSVERKINLSI